MEIPNQYIKNLYRAVFVFLVILSLFFAVKLLAEYRQYSLMGTSDHTITLSGHGEVTAVPDIANIHFTIRKEAKTVKVAQEAVAGVEKSALDFLKDANVDLKDIQATNASFNPKYEYQYSETLAPCNEFGCPPRPGKSVIVGYEAHESITVKIRNTDDVGKIIEGLGSLGITDLNGPNFAIDDEEGLKAEARKKAIDDAREKAKILTKDLGVKLGRIKSFNESGNYFPLMYSEKNAMAEDGAVSLPAELPKGESTISSDVTITYEIR